MGKMKIFALLAVSVLLVCMCASCGSEKVSYDVTVKVVTDDEILVNDLAVTVEGTPDKLPTVLEALRLALIEMDIPSEDDEASVKRIGDYAEIEDENFTHYWLYTINGAEPTSGRAGSNTVAEGDVIVFSYTTLDKSTVQ